MDWNKFRIGIMTDFSIGQSLLTTEKLVESAKAIGLEKIVVADDMTISSLIQLQRAAKAEGIDAMIGVKFRCYVDPTAKKKAGEKYENPYVALKIFAKDEEGQKTIYKILTRANSEERYYYNARGSFEDLKDLRNCVVTFGDLFGLTDANDLRKIELDPSCSLYAEFCPINTPYWDHVNAERIKALTDERIKASIVSYPAMYATLNEADSMTPLKAVCTNTNIKSPFLPHQYVRDFALERAPIIQKDYQRMWARIFNRWPALKDAPYTRNLYKTNGACEAEEFHAEPYFKFEKHAPCLPQMAEDAFAEVVRQCKEGWKTRMFTKRLGYCPDASLLPKYKDRLAYELGIIKKMGFSNYFLVVADLVNWSKNNGVRVGCGRGSAGGSLIAYLMGITEVDPIRFNLIFERFINPSRQDLPDVDLDYQSSKRYKVIEYLTAKYGVDRVSGISNYGTLASASAFRDTGRIFGLSPNDMAATKLVPKENGISATLTEAADAVPEIDKLKDTYPDVWKHALRFEGVMRSLGQHAAGTVVAGEPLVNRAVVERRAEGNVVNWDKRVVEDYGLIKMDILGLSTLDVLDIAQEYIEKNHGVKVNYLDLPLDDPKVLDAFTNGDTTAVFQFDSKGMQTLLKRLGKGGRLTFNDVSTATALYRPGPLDSGLTEEYVQIKQGLKTAHYDHPSMKAALESTYGVMVYQEQIMQVSRDLCGFTMVEADTLRRATAKKDAHKMALMKDKFIEGAMKNGMEQDKAEELWGKIEKFAAYSFNASHSFAYSILSYWTCWVKTYYPAEYFAAQLSIVKEDKYPNIIKDARSCGIEVVPPDINYSSSKFEVRDPKTILCPFSAVKGCSENTALKIVAARKAHGRFETMQDFVDEAAKKGSGINCRVVANLNDVGAFANIELTQPKSTDPSRRKIQAGLMPGLIVDTVLARKAEAFSEDKELKIAEIYQEVFSCSGCSLAGKCHPEPITCGAKCQYMLVFDCPSKDDDDRGKLLSGTCGKLVKEQLKEHGISPALGYTTALVKAKKTDKFLTNEQLNGCSKYLDREVEVLEPSVIVCLGSASTRHFLPDIKSPSAEVGNAFYNAKLDATVVVGLNPLQIVFDESKMALLDKTFAALKSGLAVE